jgi:hypothetical protein
MMPPGDAKSKGPLALLPGLFVRGVSIVSQDLLPVHVDVIYRAKEKGLAVAR